MTLHKIFNFPLLNVLIIPAFVCAIVILIISNSTAPICLHSNKVAPTSSPPSSSPITTLEHIAFGIASSKKSWKSRKEYVRLWWNTEKMRGCVFMDKVTEDINKSTHNSNSSSSTATIGSGHGFSAPTSLPPLCISRDTSRFPYTHVSKQRAAVRIARIVSDIMKLNMSDIRWYVFGDDDTVFFPENLLKTLSKYDHKLWHYIGSNSEVVELNKIFTFEMAFGGAGFAISSSLATVLAKVIDSCLWRYPHLYGSDARIAYCLAELGVGMTREPGFHQMDVRGDTFGILASHPLTPLVSLHHVEYAKPIFPNKTALEAMHHLFQAVKIDPHRVLQKTVCYNHKLSWTVSVSWGYAVEVFDRHLYLPDVLRTEKTFQEWMRFGRHKLSSPYMFSTRLDYSKPCEKATVFFFDGVSKGADGVTRSRYKRNMVRLIPNTNCSSSDPMCSPTKISEVMVLSHKLELSGRQVRAMRRHCCDVSPSTSTDKIEIQIRECKEAELSYMHA